MANNRAVKFASDVIDAKRKINGIISHCSMFKIGKTGKLLSQRFDELDYNGVYEKIDYVYRSIFAQDVDKMESVLIDNYIGNSKCKNRRDGDLSYKDDMADDALVYQVYIVWNEEEQ